ncbi:hypothetical protein RCC89_08775 [Cytophagaceae bacterium ABcell3]|nr:hypothetical protein RCC89_08775 [Cytophagaceae bacterium ABcell3]
MKRLHFGQFAAVIFAAFFALTSCKKEEETSPSSSIGTATINGTAKIDDEDANISELDGAKIFAVVDNSQLIDGDLDGRPAERLIEGRIDAAGNFSFSVPARASGNTISFRFEEHRAGNYRYTKTSGDSGASVFSGSTEYVEVTYSKAAINPEDEEDDA